MERQLELALGGQMLPLQAYLQGADSGSHPGRIGHTAKHLCTSLLHRTVEVAYHNPTVRADAMRAAMQLLCKFGADLCQVHDDTTPRDFWTLLVRGDAQQQEAPTGVEVALPAQQSSFWELSATNLKQQARVRKTEIGRMLHDLERRGLLHTLMPLLKKRGGCEPIRAVMLRVPLLRNVLSFLDLQL